QRPRLIRSGAREQLIDPREGELGLGRDVPARVAGDPADVDPIAVGDGATDDWPVVRFLDDEVTFDRHRGGLRRQSRSTARDPSNAYESPGPSAILISDGLPGLKRHILSVSSRT